MKFEYHRLSSGTHTLSHDQMDDRPVYVVNVADSEDMEDAVLILEGIAKDLVAIKKKKDECKKERYKKTVVVELSDDSSIEIDCAFEYSPDHIFPVMPIEMRRAGISIDFLIDRAHCFRDVIEDMVNRLS